MKKHLIAAAVAAAVTAPVMAQNVQVYGTLDTAIANINTGVVSYSTVESSVFATSNIGLKGTEDLGGGLKAFFDLQGDLTPDDGGVGAATNGSRTGFTTTVTGSQMFNRASVVGVSGNFGTIRAGRFADMTDATHNGSSGGFNIFNALQASSAGGKLGNSIGYTSPEFIKGLTVEVSRSLGATAEGATAATKNDQTHTTVGAKYVTGPMTFTLARATENRASASGANDSKDSNQVVSASYNLGFAAVTGVLMTDKRITKATNAIANEDQGMTVGVTIPQGAYTYIVNWQSVDEKTAGSLANDTKSIGLGVKYALSKRTALNAAYRKVTNSGTADLGGGTSGSDPKAWALGVTHSF